MCWCGSMAEQLICNQQVVGSTPITSSNMGAFPSGQRGQTVNLLSLTSVVRIHPLPPKSRMQKHSGFYFFTPHYSLPLASIYGRVFFLVKVIAYFPSFYNILYSASKKRQEFTKQESKIQKSSWQKEMIVINLRSCREKRMDIDNWTITWILENS